VLAALGAITGTSACNTPPNRALPSSTPADAFPAPSAATSVVPVGPSASASSTSSGPATDVAAAAVLVMSGPITEPIFDGAMKQGWQDYGWTKRDLATKGPAQLDFTNWGGWVAAHPELEGEYVSVRFRIKPQNGETDFLEVRVSSATSDKAEDYPPIHLAASHIQALHGADEGWLQVTVSTKDLDPKDRGFDRVILRAFRPIPTGTTLLDKYGLVAAPPKPPFDAAHAKPVDLAIDCKATPTKISPMIYGIAYNMMRDAKDQAQWHMGATARRWGGNPTSRYNWQLGNAWSTGLDWFWENVEIPSYQTFLKGNVDHGMKTALTVPILGWVAKDTKSSSFPLAMFPDQQNRDEWRPVGNGKTKDGKEIPPPPPTTTSVPSPPEFIKKWIEAIRKDDAKTGRRSVDQYILDNEPALWNSTHRDVHPEPLSYDELLDRTIKYASVIRAADPGAVIAGPAAWGWPEYFYSAKDAALGFKNKPDRLAHGDTPLLEWYLAQLKAYEAKTGTKLIDVLDVHLYPQGAGISANLRDRTTNALRIRMTRSLWDATYKDESWIEDAVQLIPRMQAIIAKSYPGLGFSVGEYSFGAETHMSGGLAQAEVLGRFAQGGVTSAFYWTYPPMSSPVFHAFRAYRDFDGKGGHFQDYSLPTTMGPDVSIFASRDSADGPAHHMVVIFLNLSPETGVRARVPFATCGAITKASAYQYTGGATGLTPAPAPPSTAGGVLEMPLPPYSVTVVDLALG
jgi:hypothetical protein